MKYVTITIVLMTCSMILFGQNTPVALWQASEYVENTNVKGPTIALDKFQNTYMITTQIDLNTSLGYTLAKYDTLGTQLWQRNYPLGFPGFIYGGFTVDSMGNSFVSILFAGTPGVDFDALIIRYDANGEKVWEGNYGLNNTGGSGIYYTTLDSMGRLLAFGINQGFTSADSADNFMFVSCIDTLDGHELWRTKMPGKFWCQKLRVLPGAIEILATEYKPDGSHYVIAQLQYDGSIIQQHSRPYTGHQIDFNYISKTGEIILGNRAYGYTITKLGVAGDTLWHYDLPEGSGISTQKVIGITEDDSHNVYVTGGRPNSLFGSIEMLTSVFSASGELRWQDAYNLTNGNLADIGVGIATDDRYIYVIGGSQDATQKTLLNIVIYGKSDFKKKFELVLEDQLYFSGNMIIPIQDKIVYTGTSHQNTSTSVNIITGAFRLPNIVSSTIEQGKTLDTHVFPNPAIGYVNISDIDQKMFHTIDIFDVDGKLMATQEIDAASVLIALGTYPAGTYTILMRGEMARLTKKIVVAPDMH